MSHPSSLKPVLISLFRSSLLYVALLSSFYVHFTFSLLFFSLSFLLIYKKMSSHDRLVQEKKQLEKEVIKQNGLQNHEDENRVLEESQFEKDDDVFEPDLMHIDYDFTNGDRVKSDSDIFLRLDSVAEDVEEDYLIEIQSPEVEDREKGNCNKLKKELMLGLLQEEGVEDLSVSDVNEIGGEDNLIEIDISMGLIR